MPYEMHEMRDHRDMVTMTWFQKKQSILGLACLDSQALFGQDNPSLNKSCIVMPTLSNILQFQSSRTNET